MIEKRVTYILDPEDKLFFRDSVPFGTGRMRSIFPPAPSVFYGAIRAEIVRRSGLSWSEFYQNQGVSPEMKKWVGTSGKEGEFSISLMCLYDHKTNGFLYPAPADMVVCVPERNPKADRIPSGQLSFMVPEKRENEFEKFASDCRLDWKKIDHSIYIRSLKGTWVTAQMLDLWLKGKSGSVVEPGKDFFHIPDLVQFDSRIGIEIEDGYNRVKKGQIYNIEMLEFKKGSDGLSRFAFAVETNLPVNILGESGRLLLGGERKSVFYNKVDKNPSLEAVMHSDFTLLPADKTFKLSFLTPCSFKDGDTPEAWKNYLQTAMVGDYMAFAGYDIAKNKPKPLKRFVPAGSVYWFEKKPEVSFDSVLENGNNSGFGCFMTGGCNS